MSKTITAYVIVSKSQNGKHVARLLDEGYTLVISWVVDDTVHHILSKNNASEEGSQND